MVRAKNREAWPRAVVWSLLLTDSCETLKELAFGNWHLILLKQDSREEWVCRMRESSDWLLCQRFQTWASQCPLWVWTVTIMLQPLFILKTGTFRLQHQSILFILFAKRNLIVDIPWVTTHPTACCQVSHAAFSTLAKAIPELSPAHGPRKAVSLLASVPVSEESSVLINKSSSS